LKTGLKWSGQGNVQSNELIVPGQNVAYSSKRRHLKREGYISGLGLLEAFKAFLPGVNYIPHDNEFIWL